MMSHWEYLYIGSQWTKEHDCVWHVREILRREAKIDLPNVSGFTVLLFPSRYDRILMK